MPNVDLVTGKITGCEEGSIEWWHEKGHLEFYNNGKGLEWGYREQLFLKWIIALLVINSFFNDFIIKLSTIALMGTCLYYYFYEEAWCWKFAYANRSKKK